MELYGSTAGAIELPRIPPVSFEGKYRPGIRLQCYGVFDSYLSIALAGTKLLRYMVNQIPNMAVHGYTGNDFTHPELLDYQYIDRQAPVGLFLGIPPSVPGFFLITRFV